MSTTTADLTGITLPPQDDAIERALSEVDAKLSAWAAAMSAAHQGLQALLCEAAVADEAESPSAQATSGAAEAVECAPPAESPATSENDSPAERTEDLAAERVAATPEAPASVPVEPVPADHETDISCAESVAHSTPTQRDSVMTPSAGEPTARKSSGKSAAALRALEEQAALALEKSAADADAAAHNRAHDEDEALLASLDPETAKAIRIMRRLSVEKKSVRELLEEYEASRSAETPAAEKHKKSWWSRG